MLLMSIYLLVCVIFLLIMCFFFFKQKTAYEMRISDWSSDVCSSDLADAERLVLEYIQRFVPTVGSAPLAGNTIGTDRAFLARYMPLVDEHLQIGRASCRERVCQYV